MIWWTRFETYRFFAIILVWTILYQVFDLGWFRIPWTPMALIGTAVAFVIGFQNNAVYGRIWEARKIWGGIVNTSRTFGVFVQDFISSNDLNTQQNEELSKREAKTLTYRHIAWMTSLRYAMRQHKDWETALTEKTNSDWGIKPPEMTAPLRESLEPYLSKDELSHVLSKSNHQTAILYLQSKHLKELKNKGQLWEFSFLELELIIKELFDLQGKTERIKNFPYPRQYASLNHYFMWLLLLLLPAALIPQFNDIGLNVAETLPLIGKYFLWLSIPVYVAVAWMFHTMERVGRTGENPFEGTSNDVPISTIARGIEIDLRQNLGEDLESIPKQFDSTFDVQF